MISLWIFPLVLTTFKEQLLSTKFISYNAAAITINVTVKGQSKYTKWSCQQYTEWDRELTSTSACCLANVMLKISKVFSGSWEQIQDNMIRAFRSFLLRQAEINQLLNVHINHIRKLCLQSRRETEEKTCVVILWKRSSILNALPNDIHIWQPFNNFNLNQYIMIQKVQSD